MLLKRLSVRNDNDGNKRPDEILHDFKDVLNENIMKNEPEIIIGLNKICREQFRYSFLHNSGDLEDSCNVLQ